MKILLAGPGTGKTRSISEIIAKHGDGSKFLILSFTNATINDLKEKLKKHGVSDKNCMSLHKFAIKYNHEKFRHILISGEEKILSTIIKSKYMNIEFDSLCDFLKCTTFDQMITRFVNYAKSNPQYLKESLASYDSLIVDEYQDFNPSEQSLIDLLIKNIDATYLLGDDDQCIYNFKNSSAEKIISHYHDSRNEKIDHAHICYRCPDKIVEHATNLITQNKNRALKEWKKSGKQGDIEYLQFRTFEDMADTILQKIKSIKNEEILILSPVKFAALPLIEKLKESGVEFTNYFAKRISHDLIEKTWEIRTIFGNYLYLNLVLFGYSKLKDRTKFYQLLKLHFDKGQNHEELFSLLNKVLPDRIKIKVKDIKEFLSEDHYKDIVDLYNRSHGKTPNEKIEDILNVIDEIEEKNIKLMSIHKSKGLEAEHVFMLGLIEGIIPNNKKGGNDTVEEQRRLFYVGMTSAKKQLYLLSNFHLPGKYINVVDKDKFKYDPKIRIYKGKASMFITELKLP